MHPEILDKQIISVHYSGQVGRLRKKQAWGDKIMGWDISKAKRRRRSVEHDDDFHLPIESIERFAPKRFLEERKMYYYNYSQIPKYRKPLLSLLIQLSEKTGIDENEELSVQTLFRKLKDFYDVNDKISLKEAVKDYSLKIKLLQLHKIFYDDTILTGTKVEHYLTKLPNNKLS
ncbi:MAG: hypothetical protein JRF50_08110 [Deltaproteobacteria bacterium]|nr:hypothetical protein [Deltaproteobacteria bacterium]